MRQIHNLSNNTREHTSEKSYRLDIDGLRGVAILLVLSFHAFPDLVPAGFIGVDIFLLYLDF